MKFSQQQAEKTERIRQNLWVQVYVEAMPICAKNCSQEALPSDYADEAVAEFDKRFSHKDQSGPGPSATSASSC